MLYDKILSQKTENPGMQLYTCNPKKSREEGQLELEATVVLKKQVAPLHTGARAHTYSTQRGTWSKKKRNEAN